MTFITDDDLLKWRRTSEDHFVERKTFGDSKDWLKTVVAFANSVPSGRSAVLFIGVRADGTVEGGQDLDTVQRSLRQKLDHAYPQIEYTTRILADSDDAPFLCVIVPASKKRPHFAGRSYIRRGSETVEASRQEHERMLTQWNDKAGRLLEAEGHNISVTVVHMDERNQKYHRFQSGIMRIVGCSPHTLTLNTQYGHTEYCPLENVTLTEQDPHFRENISLRIRVE